MGYDYRGYLRFIRRGFIPGQEYTLPTDRQVSASMASLRRTGLRAEAFDLAMAWLVHITGAERAVFRYLWELEATAYLKLYAQAMVNANQE